MQDPSLQKGMLVLPCRLTDPLGQHLAELPVDPRLGKALLASGELGCAEEVLTIVALLSVQSVWLSPHGQRKALNAAKSKSVLAPLLDPHFEWKPSCGRSNSGKQ